MPNLSQGDVQIEVSATGSTNVVTQTCGVLVPVVCLPGQHFPGLSFQSAPLQGWRRPVQPRWDPYPGLTGSILCLPTLIKFPRQCTSLCWPSHPKIPGLPNILKTALSSLMFPKQPSDGMTGYISKSQDPEQLATASSLLHVQQDQSPALYRVLSQNPQAHRQAFKELKPSWNFCNKSSESSPWTLKTSLRKPDSCIKLHFRTFSAQSNSLCVKCF